MFVKRLERERARCLRHEHGLSLTAIAAEVGVAKSTVSRWVRDIELTSSQEQALLAQNPARNGQLQGMRVRRDRCRAERIAAQQHGREFARQRNPDHIAGCMLYWAEGSKSRNAVQLGNCDDGLLRTFLGFLRSSYAVADDRVAFSVNLLSRPWAYPRSGPVMVARSSGAAAGCLRKAVINRPSSASKLRKGHIQLYGTGRIVVNSTFIVPSIYGAIQEYAGIDRPEWLDL